MPNLKFKSPEGQVITVNSPDGSMPSEQELDKLFSMAKGNGQIQQPNVARNIAQKIVGAINPMAQKFNTQEMRIDQRSPEVQAGMAKTALNVGLAGLPEIASQRITGKPFVSEQLSPMESLAGQTYGFVGGAPMIAERAAVGLLPKTLKGLSGLVTKGAVGGGAAMATQLPSPEQAPTLKQAIGQETKNIGLGAGLGAIGGALGKITPEAIQKIKVIPDKFFRGGLTKNEALLVESKYGANNGSLVDEVKNKLNGKIAEADSAYNKVFSNIPDNKFIDIKPAIEESGKVLKKLGLITEKGNLTELGNSEIARDSTYSKLLDFYKSSDVISGVRNLANKQSLTEGQIVKSMNADKRTLVNKEQYLFLRDKLNSLYRGKPSDLNVSRVANSFYQSGENSGLKGLQNARALEREAFVKSDKYLTKNGDLKIANESKLNKIGTDRPLSKQEMEHIKELQEYVNHPIIKDAISINKLNKAKELLKNYKQYAIGAAVGAAGVGGASHAIKKVASNFGD
jgi:hypothetical protein